MDREFLDKNVIPYHQFFRADLPKPIHPDKKYNFDLSQLKVHCILLIFEIGSCFICIAHCHQ